MAPIVILAFASAKMLPKNRLRSPWWAVEPRDHRRCPAAVLWPAQCGM